MHHLHLRASPLAYSLVATRLIGLVVRRVVGFRIPGDDEIAGTDLAVHGEEGYVLEEQKV